MCCNCDDEPKVQTYCRLPPEHCTWLVGVCVCVCVQGTAVLQCYIERSGGDTDELQLWPRGLWELWLEQHGRGGGGEREDERDAEGLRFKRERQIYKMRPNEAATNKRSEHMSHDKRKY